MGFLETLFGGDDEPEQTVREPAFDGLYYPDDADELDAAVRSHLSPAREAVGDGALTDSADLRGIIVPHAEYAFAGRQMGIAWEHVRRSDTEWRRFVAIGSSERVPFQGVATSNHRAFRTPLGECELNRDLIDRLLEQYDTSLRSIDVAFDPDPSIESQLPFAQTCLDDTALVPLLLGDGSPERMAEVIGAALDEQSLLVVCANLSEGLTQKRAEKRDRRTVEAIEACQSDDIGREASSARMALQSAIKVCSERDWTPRCRSRTTSEGKGGEIAGRTDQVTGYAACTIDG